MNTVSFPGLGIGKIVLDSDFEVFGLSIKWYAVCICIGLIFAYIFCERKCEYFGLKKDDFLDLALIGVPSGLLGARIGYILMDLKSFDTFEKMLDIRSGGLSIYGGIIAALLAVGITCMIKKINVLGVFDVAAIGILIGQILGRWGNFFNVEVFGVETNIPLRMGVGYDGLILRWVHPMFLYESLWNLIGLIIILMFLDMRKFKGEVFFWYMAWYGIGRFWMEPLRSPEFQLTTTQFGFKINQIIAALAVVGALAAWVYFRFFGRTLLALDQNTEIDEDLENEIVETKSKSYNNYEAQFAEELGDEASITEDEFVMKEVFEKIEADEGDDNNG